MNIKFNMSKEIMEELTDSKYPTIFEFEREGQEKIKLVRYEDYLRLHSIIKEVREYIEEHKTRFSDLFIPASEVMTLFVMLDKVYKENK